MKIRKRFAQGMTSVSLFGLVMSNMTFVHAEETKQQLPISIKDRKPEQGILVSQNDDNPNAPTLTKEDLDKLDEQGKKSILDSIEREREITIANTSKFTSDEFHRLDEKVSVIVQLKGKTVSQLSAPSASQMSLSEANSLVKEDIHDTKQQLLSTLSLGTTKSVDALTIKQDYTNVFKGFSVDNIPYGDIDKITSLDDVQAVTLQDTFYPTVNQQHDLTGIKNVWDGSSIGKPTGYKGEGMLIGIIDTGVDYTHEAFPDPTDMSKARIKKGKFVRPDGTTSLKVVDGYNWADMNTDVIPRVEKPESRTSSHGVHVAGIAAGSGPILQGVAPEAQIVAEKVFSDYQGGAMTEDIIKGIDHASALGVDVMNMSLGSSSSFDQRDPNDPMGIAIRNATDAGHIVVVAAGNASNAYSDRAGDLNPKMTIGKTPDLNKIGNPGVYPDSFTVAAANNIVSKHTVKFRFYHTAFGFSGQKDILGEGLDVWPGTMGDMSEHRKLVTLSGKLGLSEDYNGLNVTGKIVLIKRGTISFAEKVAIAKSKGAAGVIVYNQDATKPAPDPQGFGSIPFTFISYNDGMALENAFNATGDSGLCIDHGDGCTADKGVIDFQQWTDTLGSAFTESNPGQPTDFTSWGTTSDLLLKPEIMAPGHAIYSSVRTTDATKHNAYENEDGTSMAAPYVAGAVADVMQGLKEKGFTPGTRSFAQLTKNAITNTAIPAKRNYVNANNPSSRVDYMTEYQPRRQGAGMVRPDLALKTPLVVSGANGTGTISLKEIGNQSTFTLIATNITDKPVTYKLDGTVMTDVLKDATKTNSDNIRSRYLEDAKLNFDSKEITVPANGIKRVTVSLSLADTTVKNTFVEGYIYLVPTDTNMPILNVPYNGFYGKWDEPSIIDTPDTGVWANTGTSTQLGIYAGGGLYAAKDVFGAQDTPAKIALGDKFYSFNPELFPGYYPSPILGLLRNARTLSVDVVDKDHHIVTHLADHDWMVKGDPYTNGRGSVSRAIEELWNGTKDSNPVPDGQYYFAVTATADAPNARPQPTVYIPMYLDRNAPKVSIIRSTNYDESTKPEVTSTDSYTVKWSVNDGDAGNVGAHVFLAVNGSEPYTNYQQSVVDNGDGTYQMDVTGLNEGLNIITIGATDRAGNMDESQMSTVIVNKTSNHVWIDQGSATLNDGAPSAYWDANVKPGESFDLNFDAIGRPGKLAKVQSIILNDYYKNIVTPGQAPVDLSGVKITETPVVGGTYSKYHIQGSVTIPQDLPKGEYYVKFACLAAGEVWNGANVPAIGIKTYVDTDAATIKLNADKLKAYVAQTGDTTASLMLNTTVTDAVTNSRGYKVEFAVDGGAKKPMGSMVYANIAPETFRYPVRLDPGAHTIVITTTDTLGNTSDITLTTVVGDGKVTVTNNGTETVVPFTTVPYKTDNQAKINLTDQVGEKGYVVEGGSSAPAINGYVSTPYGNNHSWQAPDENLFPIVLAGNLNRKIPIYYIAADVPSWNLPGDSYWFQNEQTGYDDPGSLPDGDSTLKVKMIDILGNETVIEKPVYKNPWIPKVEFKNAVKDNTGTATFFTRDDSYTVEGTVTAKTDSFFAELVKYDTTNGSTYRDLLNPNSIERPGAYDKLNPDSKYAEIVPPGYTHEPGVNNFSINTTNLKPGPNFFSIQGGSVYKAGENYKPLGGLHPLVLSVVIYRLGTSEGADLTTATTIANSLNWDTIKGQNEDRTKIITDLTLPKYDPTGKAKISWACNNPAIIDADGKVSRQATNTTVTLTATVTVGTTTAKKIFNSASNLSLTVLAKETNEALAVAQDASVVTWKAIKGNNSEQGNVASTLTLPTRGTNGSRITWASDDGAHITNQGLVYKPLFDEEDADVELVAKITLGNTTIYNTFNLTVLKDTDHTDQTKVIRAYQALDIKQLLGDNANENDVTKDLTLPTTIGTDGVTITWESQDQDIIANDGVIVSKPDYNLIVPVRAYIKLGKAVVGKQFYFMVRSYETTGDDYLAAVQAAKASVVWNLIKKDNTDQNAVMSDLNFPTKGNNDTTITWSSSDPSIIKEDGTVERPIFETGDQDVTVKATITKGTASETKEFTIHVLHKDDNVAPNAPTINVIDDNDLTISGTTEAKTTTTIIVKNGNVVVATGNANANGQYNIAIPSQVAGTVLTVVAKDMAGNVSDASTTTVIDKTAPEEPSINSVGDNDTFIAGVVEANAVVTVMNQGKVIATGNANEFGQFKLEISRQKAGSLLYVWATDANGNKGAITTTVVLDRTAPDAPTIDTIDDNDASISGKAEADTDIVVKAGGTILAAGKVNSNGTYSFDLSVQKAGTILTVFVKDGAGNESQASTVILDRTAPNAPKINTIANNDLFITGVVEANATVTVKFNNEILVNGQADEVGNFTLAIPKQKAGNDLVVYATDASGNESVASSIIVVDKTAPDAPIINPIDDNDTVISGKAEENTTILVKKNGTVVGTGKANAVGVFSIKLSVQKAGSILTVYVKDEAGNESQASTMVLDKTAPKAPIINTMDDNDVLISGKTESNVNVFVKNNGKLIATGTSDHNGVYRIKISKQKAGTVLSVNVKDSAGNQSTTSQIKVLDRTAPNAPKITSFFAKGTYEIKGTAEANTTIVVLKGNKVIAKVKVSTKGTFTIKLPKPSKGKTEYTLYSVDQAGNASVKVKRSITIK